MSREQPNHRILVIANGQCPCPGLSDEIARRASDGPTDVLVVAPALNSRLRHLTSDVDAAVAHARERLQVAVAGLRDRGVGARGDVGDASPMLAIADALADFPATEIVIASRAREQSHWLERGLIEKASASFDLPITEVVSPSPAAATRVRAGGGWSSRPRALRLRARRERFV